MIFIKDLPSLQLTITINKSGETEFVTARGATYYFTLKGKNKDDTDQKSCICRAAVYVALDQLNLVELFEDPKFERQWGHGWGLVTRGSDGVLGSKTEKARACVCFAEGHSSWLLECCCRRRLCFLDCQDQEERVLTNEERIDRANYNAYWSTTMTQHHTTMPGGVRGREGMPFKLT
ncbi:hypothetical protein Cgig2_002062 [Carnegiea gigantea]|uniref:Uncharacterized protein n=1 Tax=Carnegiea gigantea TaxID=171969 RepID=A0A9Q1JIA8_9CARY|nr:hypothetical protein Cgig2_002062 [Carnegiea gigantea]